MIDNELSELLFDMCKVMKKLNVDTKNLREKDGIERKVKEMEMRIINMQ